jgi:hypothetical protein
VEQIPHDACHILSALMLFTFISYSFAGSAMLFLFTYILTWLRWWIYNQPRPKNYSNIILWKALVLSNCGKFLMIPSLIWGEIGTEIHSLFIMGYTFLSQLKVYSGKCILCSILNMWFKTVVVCFSPSFSAICHLSQYRQYTDMSTHMTVIQWSYDHHLHPNDTICVCVS